MKRRYRIGATLPLRCGLAGDHGPPKQRLRPLGAAQVLSPQWPLRSTPTAAQLTAILKQLVADRDRIVVAEVGGRWRAGGR